MQFYSIEFLVYPFIFLALIIVLTVIIRVSGFDPNVSFFGGFAALFVFWLILYAILSFSYNFLPCVNVLGSPIGGC